jgi:hypothetical protein
VAPPEPWYGFRAAAETRTVAQMLVHVAMMSSVEEPIHAVEPHTLAGFDFPALIQCLVAEEQTQRSKEQLAPAERFQVPVAGIQAVPEDIQVAVVGAYLKKGIGRAVPLIEHLFHGVLVRAHPEAERSLVRLPARVTFHPQLHSTAPALSQTEPAASNLKQRTALTH